MFGQHRESRMRKRQQKERDRLRLEKEAFEAQKPERLLEEEKYKTEQVEQRANKAAEDRNRARQEGLQKGEEFLQRPVQGLSDQKKRALQYEAQKQAQRNRQTANRQLLGNQSQRGIVGRGGVGFAEQQELNNAAQEAERASLRDIDILDADMALKNQANLFAMQEGFAAQNQLDKQIALDELRYDEDKRRQRNYEDIFYKQYDNQKKPKVQLTPEQYKNYFTRL